MNSFKAQPCRLIGKIQHYAWGTQNEQAFIPQFLGIPAEKDTPYAELWLGAHPKAPADILIDGITVSLDQLIREYPEEILGEQVHTRFGSLPFLFKVLSAGQALSIQAHPNKQQAQLLHAKDPEHYPDDNHKPEIAIALSDLTALAGFKTFDGLIETMENYPEITSFIGQNILAEMKQGRRLNEEQQKPLVKKMYSALMKKSLTEKKRLLKEIERLDQRLKAKKELNTVEEEFFELRGIYPGADSGLFSLFLLNRIRLQPGQGLFLKAGLPHAYLKGNIVECMANSDNVVRAGLTPKFQDVDTLVDILSYDTTPVEIQKGENKNNVLEYYTPVPEFEISRIDMRNNSFQQSVTGIQIVLISSGQVTVSWKNERRIFNKGESVMIPAALDSYQISSADSATVFKVCVP